MVQQRRHNANVIKNYRVQFASLTEQV